MIIKNTRKRDKNPENINKIKLNNINQIQINENKYKK